MKYVAVLGWILALVFAVAYVWSARNNVAIRQDNAAFQQRMAVLQEKLSAVAALDAPGDTEDAEATEAANLPLTQATAPSTPPETTIPDAPVDTEAAQAAETPGELEIPVLSAQEQQMLSAQMNALSGMMFGEFVRQLNLAPERLEVVNAAVQEALGKEFLLQQAALRHTPPLPGTEVGARREAIRSALRSALAEHLSAEELAGWDQQQAQANQLLYEQLVGGQLAMLAPALGEEARLTIQGVLGEELALALDGMEAVNDPYSMQGFVQAQRSALTAGAERLQEVLSEAEYEDLERYLAAAEQTFQAMAQ